jgi:xylulose-5-phosphate/fructose-6-phosphate phosphoketolase
VSPTPTWRAPTARSTPTSARTSRHARACSSSSPSPAASPATCAPECPGSIHEGGELGYFAQPRLRRRLRQPDLIVACVVGDGEAETGPLATAWHSNKFLNPARDGAVLPILHLNGYKIANPTVLARISHEELEQLFRGYGWTPHFVEGDEPARCTSAMAAALDKAIDEIRASSASARATAAPERPRWPMIVLRTPKGWTGPKEVDGLPGRGHLARPPGAAAPTARNPEHLQQLEPGCAATGPEELFDAAGPLRPELPRWRPDGDARMGANPHANGGLLLRDLRSCPTSRHAVDVPAPAARRGRRHARARRLPARRDALNAQRNFRIFGPDETASNRLEPVFEVTGASGMAETCPGRRASPRRARDGDAERAHSARAGSKAIC